MIWRIMELQLEGRVQKSRSRICKELKEKGGKKEICCHISVIMFKTIKEYLYNLTFHPAGTKDRTEIYSILKENTTNVVSETGKTESVFSSLNNKKNKKKKNKKKK